MVGASNLQCRGGGLSLSCIGKSARAHPAMAICGWAGSQGSAARATVPALRHLPRAPQCTLPAVHTMPADPLPLDSAGTEIDQRREVLLLPVPQSEL